MVEQKSPATVEKAIEYITDALTNGELHMKEACKELGWSFPRIRSRSLTIAKKLNCTFMKASRGVYVLDPINKDIPKTANVPSDAIVGSTPMINDPVSDV